MSTEGFRKTKHGEFAELTKRELEESNSVQERQSLDFDLDARIAAIARGLRGSNPEAHISKTDEIAHIKLLARDEQNVVAKEILEARKKTNNAKLEILADARRNAKELPLPTDFWN